MDRHETRVFPSTDDTRSSEWATESDSSPRVLFNGWGVYFCAGLWGRVGEDKKRVGEDFLDKKIFDKKKYPVLKLLKSSTSFSQHLL